MTKALIDLAQNGRFGPRARTALETEFRIPHSDYFDYQLVMLMEVSNGKSVLWDYISCRNTYL